MRILKTLLTFLPQTVHPTPPSIPMLGIDVSSIFFAHIFALFWYHGLVVFATAQLSQQSLNLTILTNQSNPNQSFLLRVGSLQCCEAPAMVQTANEI